ncbi:MAG TPA: hypothetical protein VIN07_10485 [Flavipsychrobacter sp.]
MKQEVRIHKESLSPEELQFLMDKDQKETRTFYSAIRVFMFVCFVIPFIVAWLRAMDGDENPFELGAYFLGVGFLLSFTGLCAWLAYRRSLQKIKRDIKNRSKTVERTHITRKQYMPHNHTYYFYLDSPNKLSIEVSEADYHLLNDGDELNIEYSTNAKMYFGYF